MLRQCLVYSVDEDGIQCVQLLEKKLYPRSQKQRRSIVSSATVSW